MIVVRTRGPRRVVWLGLEGTLWKATHSSERDFGDYLGETNGHAPRFVVSKTRKRTFEQAVRETVQRVRADRGLSPQRVGIPLRMSSFGFVTEKETNVSSVFLRTLESVLE